MEVSAEQGGEERQTLGRRRAAAGRREGKPRPEKQKLLQRLSATPERTEGSPRTAEHAETHGNGNALVATDSQPAEQQPAGPDLELQDSSPAGVLSGNAVNVAEAEVEHPAAQPAANKLPPAPDQPVLTLLPERSGGITLQLPSEPEQIEVPAMAPDEDKGALTDGVQGPAAAGPPLENGTAYEGVPEPSEEEELPGPVNAAESGQDVEAVPSLLGTDLAKPEGGAADAPGDMGASLPAEELPGAYSAVCLTLKALLAMSCLEA